MARAILLGSQIADAPFGTHDFAAKPQGQPDGPAVPLSARSSWRLAKSLVKLRAQIDAAAPHRSKASDGSIGDAAHFARGSASDHNPWVKDANGDPVVTAIDVTHDPARGCDGNVLAQALIDSQDPRIKYVIWNRRIASQTQSPWVWRPYNGANPHDKHVHISVVTDQAEYDSSSPWQIGINRAPAGAPPVTELAAPLAAGSPIAWGRKVAAPFKAKVIDIAGRLQVDPSSLMAVMAFETGRIFSPSVTNAAGSGAVGLIQFMPATAVSLGTTTAALAGMSAVAQLDFVEQYLRPFAGRMTDVASTYMAVLFPVAVSKPASFVLFARPGRAYDLNRGLDSDGDGKITKAEAAGKVVRLLEEGMRPENFG